MPEILSQSQIDELLSSLLVGKAGSEDAVSESGGKKVKEYDFKTPKKLTKEQMKTLLGIHENFARYLASYFSGILRTYCQITLDSIEELPYYEYNNALPDSVIVGVIDLKPVEGAVLVDISNPVTFALLERMLGGTGNNIDISREFTEIEVALMTKVLNQITSFTKEAWASVIPVEARLQQVETNARLIQSMPMEEIVIIAILNVSIWDVKGTISFCIPCINLEGLIEQLNKNKMVSKRQIDAEQEIQLKQAMMDHVKKSLLEVRFMLGKTSLTVQEIANLQVGDVIRLDRAIDSDVKVSVGGKTWFHGVPGTKKNRRAVKIKKVLSALSHPRPGGEAF